MLQEHGYQTGAVIGALPLHSRFGLNQGFDTYDEQFSRKDEKQRNDERDAQDVSRAAMSWLEQRRHKAFFLFVHYFDPHLPYEPPERFASAVGNDQYAERLPTRTSASVRSSTNSRNSIYSIRR